MSMINKLSQAQIKRTQAEQEEQEAKQPAIECLTSAYQTANDTSLMNDPNARCGELENALRTLADKMCVLLEIDQLDLNAEINGD